MRIKIYLLLVFLFSLLVFRFITFYQSHPSYHDGQLVDLTVTLGQEPNFSYNGQKFSIKTPTNQLISVNADSSPRYHYGQIVTIHGKLKSYTFPDGKTIFTLYHPEISLQQNAANPVAAVANMIRSQTRSLYQSVLPPVSASLLMGMVFGANEKFPDDFRLALQTTGVLHVIAASGMNVTFVSAALLYTLGLFLNRRNALVIGSLGIIFYVFLVGFQPSILRASIMGLLAFGAGLLGRQNMAVFALFFSGYLLLLWQPNFLFDVGFQLSFMATLGIVFVKPLLDGVLNRLGKFGELGGETITTTLAAQLGTLPILLGVFGQFGLLSVLVNALVLWTVPFVMVFGSLAAIFGLLFHPLGELFLYPAYPFLIFFETVVSFFGKSDLLIQTNSLPLSLLIGYYLVLTAFVLLRKKGEREIAKLHLSKSPELRQKE
jgi:competence protein ComEC